MGVLLTCLLAACARENHEHFITSGEDYLAKKDYPAAIIQFKNAVQKVPDNGQARYLLGTALRGSGELRSAEIEFRKAATAGYRPDLVYPALVGVLVTQGDFDKALADVDHDVTDAQAKLQLLALRGQAQLGLGQAEEARKTFVDVLTQNPGNETAMLGMAHLHAAGADFASAEAVLDKLLQRSPEMTEAMLLKADVMLARGAEEDAILVYDKVIAAEPRVARTYLTVVPLLLKQNQVPAARTRVEEMKKASPDRTATLYLDALVSYAEKNLAAARESVVEVLRVAPDHVPTLLLAGAVEHDSGAYGKAEEHLKRALLQAPNAARARLMLASIHLRMGQPELAQDQVAWLLERNPKDAVVLSLAGEVALALRDVDEAARYFQQAVALNPKNVQMRVLLAQARLASGDVQQGVQDLEWASGADEQQYRADVALIVMHLRNGKVDDALAASEVLTKKQPNNPLTYNLRGLVRVAKNDGAQARAEFEHALTLQPTYFSAAKNLATLDLREGKADAARQRYERILAVDAKHEQALIASVELLQGSGATAAEVGKAIDRALAANPQSPRIQLLKIRHVARLGDRKAALAAAQEANDKVRDNPQLLEALGRAQLANGDTNQAISTFGKVAGLLPKSPGPLLAQAEAFSAVKDWASARRLLKKALELRPDSLQVRAALLQNSVRAGEGDSALSEARDLQRRWPKNATGFLAEAAVLKEQGKPAEAERVLRQVMVKAPNASILTAIVTLLNEQGRKDDAEALTSKWMRERPKDAVVPSFLAERSLSAKNYAEAARWYRAALDAQPNVPATLNNLAWALGQIKDPAAIEYAKQAAKLAPNNPAILDTLGWLQVERGQVDEGIEMLIRAHAMAPAAAAIQLNLAKALLKAGRRTDARVHLDALTKLPEGSASRAEAEALLARS